MAIIATGKGILLSRQIGDVFALSMVGPLLIKIASTLAVDYPVACPVTYLKMLSLVSEVFWMISTAFTTILLHGHGLCATEIEKLEGEYLGT